MKPPAKPKSTEATPRAVRADAQRSLEALLEAAKVVFGTSGVDAPVREIAARAGVGIATVYRHFPQRADLVAAVFRREVDACAAAAEALQREHEPVEALVRWIGRYTTFLATKRGLAVSLHSGEPAFEALPAYFRQRLVPALEGLLRAAAEAGQIREGVEASELLRAVGTLSVPDRDAAPGHTQRMLDLLVDGLRFGARPRATPRGRSRSR